VPVVHARDSPIIMRDVDHDPNEVSPYECFECGSIVVVEDDPGSCPDCAGSLRNRRTPIE